MYIFLCRGPRLGGGAGPGWARPVDHPTARPPDRQTGS